MKFRQRPLIAARIPVWFGRLSESEPADKDALYAREILRTFAEAQDTIDRFRQQQMNPNTRKSVFGG